MEFALSEDPGSCVVFSAPSLSDAVYFLRSLVEEPALHNYSQVDVGVSTATLQCMCFVMRGAAELVELSVDMSCLVVPSFLPGRCTKTAQTYAARFHCKDSSADDVDEFSIVHQLVTRVQQCAWSLQLAPSLPLKNSSCCHPCTRPCTLESCLAASDRTCGNTAHSTEQALGCQG